MNNHICDRTIAHTVIISQLRTLTLMDALYDLARAGVLGQGTSLRLLPPNAQAAEAWAREFSAAMVSTPHPMLIALIALIFSLQKVLENISGGAAGKGHRDPTIIDLVSEARTHIGQYATVGWIDHSPMLVEGMENALRTVAAMEALTARATQPSTSATEPDNVSFTYLHIWTIFRSSSQSSTSAMEAPEVQATASGTSATTLQDVRFTYLYICAMFRPFSQASTPAPSRRDTITQTSQGSIAPTQAKFTMGSIAGTGASMVSRSKVKAASIVVSYVVNVNALILFQRPVSVDTAPSKAIEDTSKRPVRAASIKRPKTLGDLPYSSDPHSDAHNRALERFHSHARVALWQAEMQVAQAEIKAAQQRFKHAEHQYHAALDDIGEYPSGEDNEKPSAKRGRGGKGKAKAK